MTGTALASPAVAGRATGWRSGVAVAALTGTAAVMPGFTVGALAPALRDDIGVSRGTLGLAMSAGYAATALGSPVAARLAARMPVRRALALAGTGAAAVLLALSRVTGPAALAALLVAGGLTAGLVQPAAGRLIAAAVPGRRRSLAAGLVGAALGAATFVPGLLVALVLEPYGWRTAMAAAGVLALIPVALTPLVQADAAPPTAHRRSGPPPGTAAAPRVRRVLALWSLAAALSAAGNNAVASYFVHLGTDAGLTTARAGHLLSLCALVAVVVRIAAGALTDRRPERNPAVIAGMMAAGGAGLVLIAAGTPVTFAVGAFLAFSAGWGWTGLLLATALRLVPDRAESAGHTVQVGVYAGAAVAPFAFGTLSAAAGFAAASLLAAVLAVAAAGVTALAAAYLRRGRPATPDLPRA